MLALLGNTVHAATNTVTSTADSGVGTLRAALASAADGDVIDARNVAGTILLTSGELVVSNSLTILGPGPANLAVDGNDSYRVFRLTTNLVVTISGLTITNAQDLGDTGGGGIYNRRSTLTVSNCVLSGNTAVSVGGAILNEGVSGSATVTVVNSTISGNRAGNGGAIFNYGISGSAALTIADSTVRDNSTTGTGNGGAIYNSAASGGSVMVELVTSTLSSNAAPAGGGAIFNETDHGNVNVRISRTTISDNSANNSRGGGVYNIPFFGIVSLQIANSTLSGNSCDAEGGAIYNYPYQGTATVQIANCTFSSNSSVAGGAIFNNVATGSKVTLEIGSTILNAGITGGTISNSNGTVTSLGYNISSDDGGAVLTNTTDQINADPLLGPLQNNGGPTPTRALLAGSPAIDKGKRDAIPALASVTDQRGEPRPFDDPNITNASGGDGSDIGAFEAQLVYPPGDVNGSGTVTGADSLLINQVLVGLRSNTHPIFAAAGFSNGDVNQNGSVSGSDSLLLNQTLVGLRAYLTTKIVPGSHPTNVPTPVTIFGVGFPTNAVPAVQIGSPVDLMLSDVVVVNREVITAVVPPGGGLGTGTVSVIYASTNGVISFGRFSNE